MRHLVKPGRYAHFAVLLPLTPRPPVPLHGSRTLLYFDFRHGDLQPRV